MKVLVAMSGGVDSSVAAALLKEEGHDIIGATMHLWTQPAEKYGDNVPQDSGTLNTIRVTKEVSEKLDIPHIVMDFRDIFSRLVIYDFCKEYSLGRTPNPCVRCNRYIKFGVLKEKAKEMGADYIATGHHARIARDEITGTYILKKGADVQKDQSYFLCQLTQEQLGHTLFPIGHLTKDQVRQIAGEMNLPVANNPESQEICFIPNDNYPEFLKNYTPGSTEPGPILDHHGNILGEHQGLMFYTIGQRKGLGLTGTKPLYVTAIQPEKNAIVVGSREQTYGTEMVATDVNWISASRPGRPMRVKARVRYRHPEAEATVTTMDNGNVYVKFAEPQMAITPGQAVVFYDGDTVMGGGTIIRQGS